MMILILYWSGRTVSVTCHLLALFGEGVEQGLRAGQEVGDDGG